MAPDHRLRPDHWKRLEAAFYQYRDLDPARRADFLDRLMETDRGLHAELVTMVGELEDASAFLEPPPPAAMAPIVPPPPSELVPGMRLGAYQVVDRIAEGGMGAVYRATRADLQFDQTVAIKVLRRGANEPALLQRFHQERQTLAMLNHPNIAKLLDGGSTETGLPYLVMEYVSGRPIDRYCDEHALSVEARLALFAAVCDAVHHLHQNLVVHRDVKPSNILVDDAGRPKLLDFGIAKVLDDRRRVSSLDATHAGLRLMTPRFASPEQVRGEAVTTASDVYSLGVLLYVLVCGHEPYGVPDGALLDLERAVCETDPARPSSRLRRGTSVFAARPPDRNPAPADVAGRRGTSVPRLRRRLTGDLDTVVLMAMQKDPARRYGSAQQFADDVRNVVAHRPVIARRASLLDRTLKVARRNPIGATLSVALLLSLVAGAAGVLWWAERARAEGRRAEAQARVAQRQFEVAAALNEFLNSMLSSVEPGQLGVDATVRELLDDATLRIQHELGDRPHLEAPLRVTLGRSYLGLGQIAVAAEQFDRALECARVLYGDGSPRLASYLTFDARVLLHQNELEEAEVQLNEALRCLGDDRSPEPLASVLSGLAVLAQARGDVARAEALLREVLAMRRAATGMQHDLRSVTMSELANLLANPPGTRLDEAEALLEEALAIARTSFPEDHPNVTHMKVELAFVLRRKGRIDRALALADAAEGSMSKRFGPENVSLAPVWNLLAMIHRDRGDAGLAEELLNRALRAQREFLPPTHPDLAYTLQGLAELHRAKGDLAAAEAALREAFEIQEQALGVSDPRVALVAESLGSVRLRLGDLAGARAALETALAIHRRTTSERDPSTATALLFLGHVAGKQDRADDAERLYRDAVLIQRERLEPLDPRRADALFHLASVRRRRGANGEAIDLFTELLPILEGQRPEPIDRTAFASASMGAALIDEGRLDEAERVLLGAFEKAAAAFGVDGDDTRPLRAELVRLYTTTGDAAEAARYHDPPGR